MKRKLNKKQKSNLAFFLFMIGVFTLVLCVALIAIGANSENLTVFENMLLLLIVVYLMAEYLLKPSLNNARFG